MISLHIKQKNIQPRVVMLSADYATLQSKDAVKTFLSENKYLLTHHLYF